MKPTFNHVVLKPTKPEEKTSSGLYLASTNTQPNIAIVKFIGPTNAADIKEGDTVVYNKDKVTPVQHNGEDLLIITDTGILAVM